MAKLVPHRSLRELRFVAGPRNDALHDAVGEARAVRSAEHVIALEMAVPLERRECRPAKRNFSAAATLRQPLLPIPKRATYNEPTRDEIEIPYGIVVEVMAAAQRAGINNVGMINDPVLPIHKVIVKEINLIGAIKIPADDLKGVMFTRAGGIFRDNIFQRDLSILSSTYYDRGFVAVKIDDPRVSTSAGKRFIYISIKIEEGDVYSIGKIDFSGDLLVPKEGLGKLM